MTVLGLMAALALWGCDTVGTLTFQEEQVLELVPAGLTAGHCGQEGDDAVFRFSILTSFDARMEPGKRYAALEDVLDPGRNFTAGDISIGDGWLFVVGEDGRDAGCESAGDCVEGAECRTPAEMGLDGYYYSPESVCVFPTRTTVTRDPSFTHFKRSPMPDNALVAGENRDGRTIAFVLDNSASFDGSGITGIPDSEKATDPYQYRKVGLNQFMDGLLVTGESAPKYEFSAIFANGRGTGGVFDISEAWIRTHAAWNSVVMSNYPSPSGGSPVWEASQAALIKMRDLGSALYRKSLVVLTDGAANEGSGVSMEGFMRQMAAASGEVDLHWLDFTPAGVCPGMDYARAVAESCGSYHLFESAVQIPERMRNIAINTESHWDAGVAFSARLPEGHLYRLASTVVVRVGDSAVAYEAQRVSEQSEAIDRRLLVMR